jgi:diguanylate cyclase (GGDEF)-like protein
MVLVDLDHFKEINDTCGHQTGDAVLQMVGSCIRRSLRGYDVVARFGGDEFAAICIDCDPDNVVQPVQRLQRGVRNLSVPTADGRRQVSVSIGVVVIREDFENHTPHELLSFADNSLYEAKRAGRDQAYLVEVAPHQKSADPTPIPADTDSLRA